MTTVTSPSVHDLGQSQSQGQDLTATSLSSQQDYYYNATDDILDFYKESSPQQTAFNHQDIAEYPRSASVLSMPMMTNYRRTKINNSDDEDGLGRQFPIARRMDRLKPRPLSLTADLDTLSFTESTNDDFTGIARPHTPPSNNTNAMARSATAMNSRIGGVRSRVNSSLGGAGGIARRYTSLPGESRYRHNQRHSISFGSSNNHLISTTEGSGSGMNHSNTNTTDIWDEIEAMRERINRVKAGSTTTATTGTTATTTSTLQSTSNANSTDKSTDSSPIKSSQQQYSSLEDSDENHTGGEELQNDQENDWEQQEPVSGIMSSPIPTSYSKSSLSAATNTTTSGSSNNRLSPNLTRQSDAEKHLLEVIERARRIRDHDIMVVMLERVVTDTMSLYNHSDPSQTEAIDRVCLSLSDFILRFVETSEDHYAEPSYPQPQHHSRRNSPNPQYATPQLRSRYTPMLNRSASSATVTPVPSSLWYDNSHIYNHQPASGPPLSRANSIRSEFNLTQSSPITRTQSTSPMTNNRRFTTTRRFEPDHQQQRNAFF